jgi:type IV secretion system protein VirB10
MTHEKPEESPDYLAIPMQGKGTRRMNNLPKYIGMAAITFVAAALLYGGVKRFSDPEEKERSEEKPRKMATFAVPAVSKPEGPDVLLPPAPPPEIFSAPAAQQHPVMTDQKIPEHVRRRIEAHNNALNAPMRVEWRSKTPAAAPQQAQASSPSPANDLRAPDDINRQNEKREFLESFDKDASPYLKQTRLPAVSPYEVKAGFIIPGVLVSGINSDLPGQIIGQVRQNVYDSATGRHLLIPAGAKIIGTYDSRVSAGQERVLVAWNRVIFPDSSSVSLEAMPGADQSGFAGFNDQVDNHYWRTFGNAALLSLFSAGIQLSQPRPTVGGTYDSTQIMAAAIGRQLGQLGMQLSQRNLNIQPTLEIRPGFRFSVMVTKDMILPPWTGD